MRIVDIRQATVPISRYADPDLPSGGLTTSTVALVTDQIRGGRPVVGYGFASFGRFGQQALIAERFAPRLLAAGDVEPETAWAAMMAGEKPGGHGERCVAVGTLDMAMWDAAAKCAGLPLAAFLARRLGREPALDVPVYAGGGYRYPTDDLGHLADEARRARDLGFDRMKIKIGGGATLDDDRRRIDTVAKVLGGTNRVAVDAMNSYDAPACIAAAKALAPPGLWWFEDICDPLDFATQGAAARVYPGAIAAGEALFSLAEARLLDRHGGLRRDRDILLFDPVHCYGLTHYIEMVAALERLGWPRAAFWPHGGHLFTLHIVAALGLGGAEVNPFSFPPFGGLHDDARIQAGRAAPPDLPGIGLGGRADLFRLLDA